ncbi:rhox homeobox family member 1-like [Suricata suricatta]|uniref:Homeobox domain-containing protein n=1 Tax=Suricata suricatta TaxID=37032 RepID=A0A673VCY9_SURSU|nr:rhox homeobox family member 1-like [Suricata suricatta]
MEPLPSGDCFDPGEFLDPDYRWVGMQEVEVRSEPVEEAAPEAKEVLPGPVGSINSGDADHDGNYEGFFSSVNHEGDVRREGDINAEGVVNHDGSGNQEIGGGVQELGQQHPEPPPQGAAVGALPACGGPQGLLRSRFTAVQVQELENVFQRTQYVDGPTRKELARSMDVSETRVQAWFKNRRAKMRRNVRAALLRNTEPANLHHLYVLKLDPSNIILLDQS